MIGKLFSRGVLVAGVAMSVQACSLSSSVSRSWDCQAPEGMACATIEEADARATGVGPSVSKSINTSTPIHDLQLETSGSSGFTHGRTWTGPARVSDLVMRVWMAAYVDDDGNYHDPSVIYMAVPRAQWVTEQGPGGDMKPVEWQIPKRTCRGGRQC